MIKVYSRKLKGLSRLEDGFDARFHIWDIWEMGGMQTSPNYIDKLLSSSFIMFHLLIFL